MISMTTHEQEARRLRRVQASLLLYGAREAVFDQLAELAAELCQTAMAYISVVDGTQVWFKASCGLASKREMARVPSLCDDVVKTGCLMEVADASLDPRTNGAEIVHGMPFVRLYASAPLVDESGMVLGTLAVMDGGVRRLSTAQRNTLIRLAVHASHLIQHSESHRRLARNLSQERSTAMQVYRKAPVMLLTLGAAAHITDASDMWLSAMGYSRLQMVGMDIKQTLSSEASQRFRLYVQPQLLSTGHCKDVPLTFIGLKGQALNVLYSANAERSEFGELLRSYVTLIPMVTDASVALRQCVDVDVNLDFERDRSEATLRSIGDAVISTDIQCRVEYMNPTAEVLTGWLLAEARGKKIDTLFQIVHEHTRAVVESPLARCLSQDQVVGLPSDSVLVNRHGKSIAIEDTATPIRDRLGYVTGAVMVFHDVSVQRRLQQEISHQSSHDVLTGLANRREFELQLKLALEGAATEHAAHAVCYIDLDQFKVVNDTSGHGAGDELLRQISSLMREKVRKNDVLARLGGDEFGVLLRNCPLDQAQQVAENLRQAVDDFRFAWHSITFKVGASVGLVPLTPEVGSIELVMQAADKACYAAKDGGRNRVHLYIPQDVEMQHRSTEMSRVAHLPTAIEEQRFQLYAQEIAPLQSSRSGASNIEILIRLKDVDGTIIEPGAFLPAAERYNRATTIDRWVVNETLNWLSDNATFVRDMGHCAINLSGQSLCDASFHQYVMDELDRCGVASRKICFEITETAAIANLSRANKFMHALRDRGCHLALDDFGSGLSSFGYLRNLPVNILKIDGMFVRGIVCDPVDEALVRSINCIGQLLGKETVAECVEDSDTLSLLTSLGVNYAQGYTLGRPEPLDALASRW